MDITRHTIGRSELLEWINNTFQTRYNKIEETCDGAIACQIIDCLYPGILPLIIFLGSILMSKVGLNYKNSFDYFKNYKVLQSAFTKNGIDHVYYILITFLHRLLMLRI